MPRTDPHVPSSDRRLWLAAAAAAVVVCVGVGLLVTPGTGTPPPRNVVLILLDTLRADKLGCYGNQRGLTPRLDAFAAESVRFERAYSQAPWTLPSLASLFTSLYPGQHGAGRRAGSFRRLEPEAKTMAEIFRDAGMATGAVVNVLFLTDKFGMSQGFDDVSVGPLGDNLNSRRAGPTTDAALSWLSSRGGGPFFLATHYFDPHLAYDPPQPWRRRFADPRDAETEDHLFGSVGDMMAFRRGELSLDPDTIGRLEKLHDGEVAYLDHEVGRLLDGITALGLAEETVVVIAADHGEEFLDHGGFEHGHTLYDELLHVPLMIRTPSAADPAAGTPRAVPTVVRHVDVLPTLCELLRLPESDRFAGESLLPLLRGHPDRDRAVLSQGNMWGPSGAAWIQGGYKLIREIDERGTVVERLFDLAADPGETRNLAADRPDVAARMNVDRSLVQETLQRRSLDGRAPELKEDEIRRLQSLGYVR